MTEDEYKLQIEDGLSVEVPVFKTKEEILQNARERNAAKRLRDSNKLSSDTHQGTTIASQPVQSAVYSDQGYYRGGAEHSTGADAQGRNETQHVYAGDGRDEAGERGSNGYTNNPTIIHREPPNGGGSSYQYDGPTGRPGREPIFTKKTSGKKAVGGGVKSRMKAFVHTAFGPDESKEEEKAAQPKKQPNYKGPQPKGKYATMSEDEAEKLRPKLIMYITWQSEHLDQFIIATTKGHDPTIEIWSNMDEAEIEILADYLLLRSRRDPITAQAVRFAAEILERIKVGIIVLPRVYRTVTLYFARGLDIPIWVR